MRANTRLDVAERPRATSRPLVEGDPGAEPPLGRAREGGARADLVCFCHLRWNFVYQRPQHLMTRHTRRRRVYFMEEPVRSEVPRPRMQVGTTESGVVVAVPHVPSRMPPEEAIAAQRELLDALLFSESIECPQLWYYTPLALAFSQHVDASFVVYDCMDELSAFRGASPLLVRAEERLLAHADVVFTGGWSLYEAKRLRHPHVFGLPSSVDVSHFGQARSRSLADPSDQAGLRRPRLGFFGVIDERMDLELLAGIADRRPAWDLVLLGPVVKVDPEELPRRSNLHYLGPKTYDQLPAYLAHWDVSIMPFARNEATRFISPTKTPEYLAAGCPVVSTSIRDVVYPYGEERLVRIADTPDDFVEAVEQAMTHDAPCAAWRERVEACLAGMSWERTFKRAEQVVGTLLAQKRARSCTPGPPAGGVPPVVLAGAEARANE